MDLNAANASQAKANAIRQSILDENAGARFDRGDKSGIIEDTVRAESNALMDKWGLQKAPVRITADALHLPFADNSLRCVMAFQMLSQFMNIEAIFVEVKRVLAPGGVFLFAEEPLRRDGEWQKLSSIGIASCSNR